LKKTMTIATPKTFPWRLARRTIKMSPSAIREILKITERPGIISFAGGLPSPKTFPVAEFEAACAKVLHNDAHAALQYAASEGFGPLRDVVAARLPWQVDPAQILITTGSQQGLDLVAKVSPMIVTASTWQTWLARPKMHAFFMSSRTFKTPPAAP
jgi:2-aminoadipate transaminase